MPDTHLSDQELVFAADGELAADRARHLLDCDLCRQRRDALTNAATAIARLQQQMPLPSHATARARLRVAMSEIADSPAPAIFWWRPWYTVAAGACAILLAFAILGLYQWQHGVRAFDVPSPRLTPGAARIVDRDALCNSELPKNQVVPAALRQQVFQAYGIAHADPRAYEVDYLITPALGGADDIRNLWPEPYVSTVWNARVKDQLEDRLRDLVCGGRLELSEAQHDIARDWKAAYKKYLGKEPQ